MQEELVCNVSHQALKNLALQMERVLLADSNPKISMDGIRSFAVDLTHCQSQSPPSSKPHLLTCFLLLCRIRHVNSYKLPLLEAHGCWPSI